MAVAHGAEYGPESSLTVTLPPLVKDGSSFTALTVMTNTCDGDVSSPPLAKPPSSVRNTVTLALPKAFAAGVNISTPLEEIDGCDEKSALLSFETWKVTVCDDSLAGPALMAVAHGAEY